MEQLVTQVERLGEMIKSSRKEDRNMLGVEVFAEKESIKIGRDIP